MLTKKCLFVVCATAFCAGSVALAVQLKKKVIVERESLKILVGEKFPEELDCEIFVGSDGSPHFSTEGEKKRMKVATIDIDLGRSVSVIRKEVEGNSYFLYLFFEDEDGKSVGQFDLNIDGTWDVKKCPTRKENSILVDGHWVRATRIDRLLSPTPTAEAQGVRYQFQGGWKVVK